MMAMPHGTGAAGTLDKVLTPIREDPRSRKNGTAVSSLEGNNKKTTPSDRTKLTLLLHLRTRLKTIEQRSPRMATSHLRLWYPTRRPIYTCKRGSLARSAASSTSLRSVFLTLANLASRTTPPFVTAARTLPATPSPLGFLPAAAAAAASICLSPHTLGLGFESLATPRSITSWTPCGASHADKCP